MKTCSKCKKEKDESEFYKRLGRTAGVASICSDCTKASTKAWRTRNKVERRLQPHGLTTEDFNLLVCLQRGRCAICGKIEPQLNIDHCHTTGKVRGLLCTSCNRGLGFFFDSIENLLQAIKYLSLANQKENIQQSLFRLFRIK